MNETAKKILDAAPAILKRMGAHYDTPTERGLLSELQSMTSIAVQLAKDTLAKEATQEPSGLVERLRARADSVRATHDHGDPLFAKLDTDLDYEAADAIESRDAALKAAEAVLAEVKALKAGAGRKNGKLYYLLYDVHEDRSPHLYAALKGGNDGL